MSKIKTDYNIKNRKKEDEEKLTVSYGFPLYITSLINGLSIGMNIKEYKVANSILHKVYSIVLCAAIIVLTVYSLHGRIIYGYKFYTQTAQLNDLVQQVSLTFANCYAVLNTAFRGPTLLKDIYKKSMNIDKQLGTAKNCRWIKMQHYLRFFVSHVIFLLICFGDYFVWFTAMDCTAWKYFGFKLYTIYACMLVGLQIYEFASNLRDRFVIVNEKLVDSFLLWSDDYDPLEKKQLLEEIYPKELTAVCTKYFSVKDLTNLHDMLCDVMDLLNEIYGCVIFLLVSNFIVTGVVVLNVIFLYVTGMQVAVHEEHAGRVVLLNATCAFFFAVSIDL